MANHITALKGSVKEPELKTFLDVESRTTCTSGVRQGARSNVKIYPAGFEGWVLSIALQGGLALPIILGNVILFISVPILADRYERHSTFAGKELAIMLKLTFFQVFNTCVAAAAFLVDPNVWSNSRHWYTLGGALLANVTLGDAIFIQLLLDFVQLPVLINRCFIARGYGARNR